MVSEYSHKSKFQDWYNNAYTDIDVKMTTLLEKMIVPTLALPEFDYTDKKKPKNMQEIA